MTEHGGNEEIAGGDATQRDRVAKAAQEAFYDLGSGTDPEKVKQHIMRAYDGNERAYFEGQVDGYVDDLAELFESDEADERGFVMDLMLEYDRRYGDADRGKPWATEIKDTVRFLEAYAAHHYGGHATPIGEDGKVLFRAAEILRSEG